MFSVSVSSPLPLNRSYRIEFYFFRTCRSVRSQNAWSSAHSFARETRCPASLACRATVVHTPSNGIRNGRYGHGFYGNSNGNGNVTLETFSSARCSDSSAYMHRCRPDAVALARMNVAGYPMRRALPSAAVGVWSDAIGVLRLRWIVRRIQLLGPPQETPFCRQDR